MFANIVYHAPIPHTQECLVRRRTKQQGNTKKTDNEMPVAGSQGEHNHNNNNLRICADLFASASLLQWKEGYIPRLLGVNCSSPGYIPSPAIPPYFSRTLHMRGAQSTGAPNAL